MNHSQKLKPLDAIRNIKLDTQSVLNFIYFGREQENVWTIYSVHNTYSIHGLFFKEFMFIHVFCVKFEVLICIISVI